MTTKAVLVPVGGSARVIDWPEDDGEQLTASYEAIGCTTVEMIRLKPLGLLMWVDEEGRSTGAEMNDRASQLVGVMIVGNVILTPYSDGETSPGFSDEDAAAAVEEF